MVPLALLDAAVARRAIDRDARAAATGDARRRVAAGRPARRGRAARPIGYRMRGESRVGPRTRIEVVTEGVLTRRLQRDPTLDGVGIVDLRRVSRAKSRRRPRPRARRCERRRSLRDDLRIVVMSATLDGGAVAETARRRADRHERRPRRFRSKRATSSRDAGTRIEAAVANAIVGALRDDERRRSRLSPRRRRDPSRRGAARRPRTRRRRRHAALRNARARRAGPRALPGSRRPPKGRARHVDRRNEPDDRRNSRRRGQRTLARSALLASHRHDAPRDGSRVSRSLGRSAPRARRPTRRRAFAIVSGRSTRPLTCSSSLRRRFCTPTWRRSRSTSRWPA